MNASKKYKIGITFNLESEISDIWANGANQNVIHLYNLFKHSSLVENVVLVSWGAARRTTPPEGFLLDGLDINFAYIDDVIDELDVLINRGNVGHRTASNRADARARRQNRML